MIHRTITLEEYNKLVDKLKFFDTTRNTLSTFSYTSVLAVIGVALGIDNQEISSWIFLTPFFLIIPFSARISYYRLAYIHISSFLKIFAPGQTIFEHKAEIVSEQHGRLYRPISWLINHDMFPLGLATDAVFLYKYIQQTEMWDFKAYMLLIIPAFCTVFTYFLQDATYDFGGIRNDFSNGWKKLL